MYNVHEREWDSKHPADNGQQGTNEQGDSTSTPVWGKLDS